MYKLEVLLSRLEAQIPDCALLRPAVSGGSIGWHIEHCLFVINLVIAEMKKSNPADHKPRFDFRRVLLMTWGKIPRGKINAPKMVQPNTEINVASLSDHILRTRESIQSLEGLTEGNYFKHPFLGEFKVKPALKFLKIHTVHHLNIIHDIISKKEASS